MKALICFVTEHREQYNYSHSQPLWAINFRSHCLPINPFNIPHFLSCWNLTFNSRAVAASQVSLVSTRPHFPLLLVCLALPISTIAQKTPTQGPHALSVHWEGTVGTSKTTPNSAKESLRVVIPAISSK